MSNSNGPSEIHPTTLQEWLREKKPVQIIDIRPQEDYEDWHIAEAENIDSYYAIQKRDPGKLAEFEINDDTPVVTVCYAGVTSKLAANYLHSKGANAYSLIGGMQWWSMAWNDAELNLNNSSAKVIQVRRTGKGCLSYIIESDGEALVIDPSVDSQIYLDIAKEHGWTIIGVIDTHVHADHLSRGRGLANESGSEYYLPNNDRVHFEYNGLEDGDVLEVGSSKLKAIHTPGHTYESTSYLLDNEALFTGDTIFPTSIGRPDLKAGKQETEERTRILHKSLKNILELDPDIKILAGHTNKPVAFNDEAITTTVGSAKSIKLTQLDENEFVNTVISRIPANPPNHLQIIEMNEKGIFPPGDTTILEAGSNRCAI